MSHFKKAFISRYKDDGVMFEVDWSQLEIVCQQIESQDEVLGRELRDGIDLHSAMTAEIYPERGLSYTYVAERVRAHDPVWVERRKQTKRARFALQYGAREYRISQLTGWDIPASKKFISMYEDKYVGIVRWQAMVKRDVQRSSKPCDTEGSHKGQYTSPTGRRFVFQSDERKQFSPTQLKNYPIQGMASDFVALMTGKLMRDILYYGMFKWIHLVNTIHDSLVIDVHKDVLDILSDMVDTTFGQAPEGMRELVQGKRLVNVPIKYATTIGSSWAK
jgi:DNA polymerase I-like protein with 3'-5' exonuclease and polymerase domains